MNQIYFNILLTTSIYCLLSISFSILYSVTKFFNIALAAIITLSAYFVYLFANKFVLIFPLAVALAIIAATFVGALCEVLIFRRMRKKNVPLLSFLIVSIGLYVVLQNSVSLIFGDNTKIINVAEVTIGNQIIGAYITNVQIMTFIVSVILFFVVNLFLHYTTTGKSIRAVSSNPELCNIYGISTDKIILISFVISSALAATSGILSAMDTNMTPTFGFNLLLYGVIAMIIGGVGSTKGLIMGSLIVATTQHLAAYYIDAKWMDAFTYIILISFMIWKPLGLSGKLLKKIEV